MQATLNWMSSRIGKITYSQYYRNGPSSYDCSSAVFYALRAGGFPHTGTIGNTDTLFGLRGKLLTPISRSEITAGCVFVSGDPGSSGGDYGHAGFAWSATEAIHCSSSIPGGIGITSNADSRISAFGKPVYWYRVVGSSTPAPTPEEPDADLITIESVNDGKKYVDNEFLIDHFGIRMGTETFNDVESEFDTMQKGIEFMNEQPLDWHEITLTRANLELVNVRYNAVRVGDVVNVQNPYMQLEPRMRIEEKQIDIINTHTSDLTVGRKFDDLTDYYLGGI